MICTARDSEGVEASSGIELTVLSPVVSISAPAQGSVRAAGTPVRFDGQGCDAEEGTQVSLKWYLDGSTNVASTAASFSTTLAAGTHRALLVVRDSLAAEASTEVTFRLSRPPPR